MMKKMLLFFTTTLVVSAGAQLLLYCGITMVPAVTEAKKHFEQSHDCTVTLIQGGSKDLCKSIQTTRQGDLFLPGKSSYIDQCGEAGYIRYRRLVGYNRLGLFVPRGNPKHIHGLGDLLRSDLLTTLGNPRTCSIGKAAEETLLRYGGSLFLDRVYQSLGLFAADSRDMNHLLLTDQADVGLNWIASLRAVTPKGALEALPLSDLYAQPQELVIGVLAYSPHSDLARQFSDYLASPAGKEILKKYGFTTNE